MIFNERKMVFCQENGPNTINRIQKASIQSIIIVFNGGYYIYAMYVNLYLSISLYNQHTVSQREF